MAASLEKVNLEHLFADAETEAGTGFYHLLGVLFFAALAYFLVRAVRQK
ncbi:MAG: hypothetical protein LH618_01930 [Saprospiraceae bacterium]|nr:hypothetical protein [Saprospiraceae bacterium]